MKAVWNLGNLGLNYPDTAPKDSPRYLWSLQVCLLSQVEELLGPRESSKRILQPAFRGLLPRMDARRLQTQAQGFKKRPLFLIIFAFGGAFGILGTGYASQEGMTGNEH